MVLLDILNTFDQICLEQTDSPWICELEEFPFTKISRDLIHGYRYLSANASLPQRVETIE